MNHRIWKKFRDISSKISSRMRKAVKKDIPSTIPKISFWSEFQRIRVQKKIIYAHDQNPVFVVKRFWRIGGDDDLFERILYFYERPARREVSLATQFEISIWHLP